MESRGGGSSASERPFELRVGEGPIVGEGAETRSSGEEDPGVDEVF